MSFKNGDTYNFSLSNFYNDIRSTVVPTAPPGLLYVGDKGVNGKSGMAPIGPLAGEMELNSNISQMCAVSDKLKHLIAADHRAVLAWAPDWSSYP